MRLSSKLPVLKKRFTIFDQFLWNFVHLTNSLLEYFGNVSLKLDKKCRIFTNCHLQHKSHFSLNRAQKQVPTFQWYMDLFYSYRKCHRILVVWHLFPSHLSKKNLKMTSVRHLVILVPHRVLVRSDLEAHRVLEISGWKESTAF